MFKIIKRKRGNTLYYIYKESRDGFYTMSVETGKISHSIRSPKSFVMVEDGWTIDEVMQELGYKPNPTRVKGCKRRKMEGESPRRESMMGMKFQHQGKDYTLTDSKHNYLYDEMGFPHERTQCYFYPLTCKNGKISRDRRNYPKGVKIMGIDE